MKRLVRLLTVTFILLFSACNGLPRIVWATDTPVPTATGEVTPTPPVPSPTPKSTSTPRATSTSTPEPITESGLRCICFHPEDSYWSHDQVTQKLDLIEDAFGQGVWVRFDAEKLIIEKKLGGLEGLKELIDQIVARGFRVHLILSQWGSTAPGADWEEPYPDSEEYIKFVQDTGTTLEYLGDKIRFEIGNEPDHKGPEVERYTLEFLIPAYDTLKQINPDWMVISAGVTPSQAQDWLRGMYSAASESGREDGFFDAFGYHFYAQEEKFRRIERIVEIMEENGDKKPIAVTEYGVPTEGEESVSEEEQATWLTKMHSIATTDYPDLVISMCIYQLTDKLNGENEPDKWGITREIADGFDKKSAFLALKEVFNPSP